MAIRIGDAILYITGDISGMNTAMSGMKRSVLLGVGAVIGILGSCVKASAEFEQAITNAATVTGYTGEALDKAKKKIAGLARELGENTVFTARQAADAMYDLASKGFKPAEMSIQELQPYLDLAAATQSDLSRTTEIVTSSIRAFGLENKESARVADVYARVIGSSAATIDKLGISMTYIAPIAKAMGMSIEDTAAALGKLYDRGFEASQAGTALRGMITRLTSDTKISAGIFAKLGVTFDEINPVKIGLVNSLDILRDAGLGVEDAMKLFGQRAGPAALALMGISKEGKTATDEIRELAKALEDSGGAAKQMAEDQLNTLESKTTLLKSAWESLRIEIGTLMIPKLKEMVDEITEVIKKMNAWVKAHPELTEKLLDFGVKVGGVVLALWGLVKVWSAVTGLFAIFTGSIAAAVVLAIGSIGIAIYSVNKAMKDFKATWGDVWEGMIEQINIALEYWGRWTKAVSEFVWGPLPLPMPVIAGAGIETTMSDLPDNPEVPFGNGSGTMGASGVNVNIYPQGVSARDLAREVKELIQPGIIATRGGSYTGKIL